MTMNVVPPAPSIFIPENAPFSPAQRAWLSGFFSGVFVPPGAAVTPLPAGSVDVAAPSNLATNDDAPWHDPGMALDERMKLADGKPIAPRLMAAMAQQDCGQCGYLCATYANAIADGSEKRLTLCAPGGKETLRMLKELAVELDATPAKPAAPEAAATGAAAAAPGRSRDAMVEARFTGRRRVTKDGSAKDAWHIAFDLTDSGLDYVVGDSFGLMPQNEPGLVAQIMAVLGASPTTPVRGSTLHRVLTDEVSLGAPPDALFELFSYLSGGSDRTKARALARGEDPDGDAATLDVLAALMKFPKVRPHPEAFVEALDPLQPRLYSISSSPKTRPGEVTLTVDAVRYVIGKRKRLGVASTFLADRLAPGSALKVYVQRAHGFGLPADPTRPVIMVGPGTGIAPFRAFLEERAAVKATGKNWLFFGHQRQATDFFYEEELAGHKKSGVLTRLSLAWSRDGSDKVYVQDRMRENGAELWRWLAEGAHFYICGDAKRMAKDVEAALVDIIATHGKKPVEEALRFVRDLKQAGRYQADVY